MGSNRVRIVGGEWRSRWIKFPDIEGLRPTPDRVRETLFNWLGQDLSGQTCLDLFAGSGALGFEAASRGARQVIFVERDRQIVQALEQNANTLDPQGTTVAVMYSDALEFLRRDRRTYDVIFVDPPYPFWHEEAQAITKLLEKLTPRLNLGAQVYLEADIDLELPPEWQTIKNNRAGAVHYQLARPIAK